MLRATLAGMLCIAALSAETVALAPSGVTPVNVKVEAANFKGKSALKVMDVNPATGDEIRFAVVNSTSLQDGTIDVELTGDVLPGVGGGARGFVGIAFRMEPKEHQFECFYLRPTNGRAEDQERRNHSAQYISIPGFGWQKLRQEFPSRYEAYVDLEPAVWTPVKIVIKGTEARLFVHNNAQPTLIVKDLKQKTGAGAVGLWLGPGTVAHFANLKLTK